MRTNSGERKRRIGIWGVHPAAGATHFTMLAAAYFSHYCRRQTEVYERNDQEGFLAWQRFLNGHENASAFRTRRCIFYPQGAQRIASSAAEVVLYDFGFMPGSITEFLSCDEKWVIGSNGLFGAKNWKNFFETKEVRNYLKQHGTISFSFILNQADTGRRYQVPVPAGLKRRIMGYGLGVESQLLIPSKKVVRLFNTMESRV